MLKQLDNKQGSNYRSASEFILLENSQIYESVWNKLSRGSAKIPSEKVRFFFLNTQYLWGKWLAREKLLAKDQLPNRHQMKPKILNQRVLHSVPQNYNSHYSSRSKEKTAEFNKLEDKADYVGENLEQFKSYGSIGKSENDNEMRIVKEKIQNFGAKSEAECRKLINDY